MNTPSNNTSPKPPVAGTPPATGLGASPTLPRSTALIVFMLLNIIWGANWPNTKSSVAEISPLWVTAIRTILAVLVIFPLQIATRQLVRPTRQDLPVILAISILHMSIYASLMGIGLQYVSAGRSAVLAYTTPLWVAPGAWLFLKEPMPGARILGVLLGLAGIVVLFNPLAFDWADQQALRGNGLLLLAALIWAVCILIVRRHKWQATPFQLTSWQLLLACFILIAVAFAVEGPPAFSLNTPLVLRLMYNGIMATAIGFWLMAIINKSLPATTTSLGSLGTPVAGIFASLLFLGETPDIPLLVGTAMIIAGVAFGVLRPKSSQR